MGDRLDALYCGVPAERRDRRPIAMLQVFIDDSKTGEEVLVLAGYVGHWVKWKALTEEWNSLLKQTGWDEFKMTRASRCPEIGEQFYRIAKAHVAVSLACVVEIAALRQLCDELGLPKFCRNPYNWALKALPGATYIELGEAGTKYPMEFIFDERGEKKYLRDGWPFFLMGLPPQARLLAQEEPKFAKSHDVIPLQTAEIPAWHARKHWLKHRQFDGNVELLWADHDPIKGLLVHWDYKALEPNMRSMRDLLINLGVMSDPDV